MNRGKGSPIKKDMRHQGGYTIVEVLIFLAVSAVLFGSTMIILAGRQQKTQFSYATRDFEARIQDIANDVSNGYYSSGSGIVCDSSLTITAGSQADLGTNDNCILLGRIIKFGDTDPEKYGVYSLVGHRKFGNFDVRQLADASPKLLWNGSDLPLSEGLREIVELGYGTKIVCAYTGSYAAGKCNPNANGAIAFVTNLSGSVESGGTGGAISTKVYIYPTTSIGAGMNTFEANAGNPVDTNSEPVTICIQSGSTSQYALIKMTNGRTSNETKQFTGVPSCS